MKLGSFVACGSVVAVLVVGCSVAPEEETRAPSVTAGKLAPQTVAPTTNGPDLTVDPDRLQNSVDIVQQNIASNSCAVVEGCVTGTGKRKLMRFDVLTPNIGNVDVKMGSPRESPDLYEYSACHRHFHLKDYAKYELLDGNGDPVMLNGQAVVGRKQAFCLLDSEKYYSTAASSSGYSCSNQGITSGWADLYYKTLDCQWIDITGVPNSDATHQYQLRVTVNAGRVVNESGPNGTNYDNNSVTVPVTITDPTGQNGGRPRPAR